MSSVEEEASLKYILQAIPTSDSFAMYGDWLDDQHREIDAAHAYEKAGRLAQREELHRAAGEYLGLAAKLWYRNGEHERARAANWLAYSFKQGLPTALATVGEFWPDISGSLEIHSPMALGAYLLARGRLVEAATVFERASWKRVPVGLDVADWREDRAADTSLLVKAAECRRRIGDLNLAAEFYRDAWPFEAGALADYCMVVVELGGTKPALDALIEAIDSWPIYELGIKNALSGLRRLGFETSVSVDIAPILDTAFQAAIEHDPRLAVEYCVCLADQGRYYEAATLGDKYSRQFTDLQLNFWDKIAHWFREMGAVPQAIDAYVLAVRAHQIEKSALDKYLLYNAPSVELAKLFEFQAFHSSALQVPHRCVRLTQEAVDVFMAIGLPNEARRVYRRAIDAIQDVQLRGRLQAASDNFELEFSRLGLFAQDLEQQCERGTRQWLDLASAWLEAHDSVRAVAAFKRAIQRREPNAALAYAGYLAGTRRDPLQAAAVLEAVLEADLESGRHGSGGLAAIHGMLAGLYDQTHQGARALTHWDEAAGLSTGDTGSLPGPVGL